jgi:hypothetical protein
LLRRPIRSWVEESMRSHGTGIRIDLWVNKEIIEWFSDVENEYDKLRKSLNHT